MQKLCTVYSQQREKENVGNPDMHKTLWQVFVPRARRTKSISFDPYDPYFKSPQTNVPQQCILIRIDRETPSSTITSHPDPFERIPKMGVNAILSVSWYGPTWHRNSILFVIRHASQNSYFIICVLCFWWIPPHPKTTIFLNTPHQPKETSINYNMKCLSLSEDLIVVVTGTFFDKLNVFHGYQLVCFDMHLYSPLWATKVYFDYHGLTKRVLRCLV